MVYQYTPCILSIAVLIDLALGVPYFFPLAWGVCMVIVWLMMLYSLTAVNRWVLPLPKPPSWSEMVLVVKHHPSTHQEQGINLLRKSHQFCRRINILNIWHFVFQLVDGW